MGKIIFDSTPSNSNIEVVENLGPIVVICNRSNLISTLMTSKHFKDVNESEDIWAVNTKINPVDFNTYIVTADKVLVNDKSKVMPF